MEGRGSKYFRATGWVDDTVISRLTIHYAVSRCHFEPALQVVVNCYIHCPALMMDLA